MMFTGKRMLRSKARLGPPHPRCRWAFPTEPPPDLIASSAEGGVPGPATGVVGWPQAVLVAKEIPGVGDGPSGTPALHDTPGAEVRRGRFARGADCPVCGAAGGNGADHG
jgi:molybdopterin/thiamine biosynthesis adenylyltransferase